MPPVSTVSRNLGLDNRQSPSDPRLHNRRDSNVNTPQALSRKRGPSQSPSGQSKPKKHNGGLSPSSRTSSVSETPLRSRQVNGLSDSRALPVIGGEQRQEVTAQDDPLVHSLLEILESSADLSQYRSLESMAQRSLQQARNEWTTSQLQFERFPVIEQQKEKAVSTAEDSWNLLQRQTATYRAAIEVKARHLADTLRESSFSIASTDYVSRDDLTVLQEKYDSKFRALEQDNHNKRIEYDRRHQNDESKAKKLQEDLDSAKADIRKLKDAAALLPQTPQDPMKAMPRIDLTPLATRVTQLEDGSRQRADKDSQTETRIKTLEGNIGKLAGQVAIRTDLPERTGENEKATLNERFQQIEETLSVRTEDIEQLRDYINTEKEDSVAENKARDELLLQAIEKTAKDATDDCAKLKVEITKIEKSHEQHSRDSKTEVTQMQQMLQDVLGRLPPAAVTNDIPQDQNQIQAQQAKQMLHATAVAIRSPENQNQVQQSQQQPQLAFSSDGVARIEQAIQDIDGLKIMLSEIGRRFDNLTTLHVVQAMLAELSKLYPEGFLARLSELETIMRKTDGVTNNRFKSLEDSVKGLRDLGSTCTEQMKRDNQLHTEQTEKQEELHTEQIRKYQEDVDQRLVEVKDEVDQRLVEVKEGTDKAVEPLNSRFSRVEGLLQMLQTALPLIVDMRHRVQALEEEYASRP